ncbi:MAG: glucose-6-phosphate isomerase [Thaumarchaeota archaeon]|nr:MAG: glucose-6-phosphate isomerase [Nitrososphaerota archaeon]
MLINLTELQKIDSKKIYQVYDMWPKIARNSYEYNWGSVKYENINHIVFAGMGGSGSVGDIFSSILSKTNLYVSVVKGYILPKTVDKNSLVICTSVSGNTVETLSILNQAKNLNCKLIAFSSGGKIEEFCKSNKIDYRKISQFNSPRASLTSFVYSMLKILEFILPITKEEVIESIISLEKTEIEISSNNLTESNQALNLAKWISGIPLIYYPWGLQASAIRFKNSLQENAKMHALSEDVIEACHNGIVAWEKKSVIQPILIKGDEDNIKTKERWRILSQYFDERKIKYYEIHSIKGNILSKLINLIYLFDYSSIYKAILDKVDPTPVSSIDYVKKQL